MIITHRLNARILFGNVCVYCRLIFWNVISLLSPYRIISRALLWNSCRVSGKKNLVGIENWTFKRRLVQCRSISGPHPSPHIYTTQILIRSATSAAGFAYASHLCSLFDKSHNPSEFHLRLLAEIFLNEYGNLSYLDEEKSYWVIFSSIYLNCLLKVFLFFDP